MPSRLFLALSVWLRSLDSIKASFPSGSAHNPPSGDGPHSRILPGLPITRPLNAPGPPSLTWLPCPCPGMSKTLICFESLLCWETSKVSTAYEIKPKRCGMAIKALHKTWPNFSARFGPVSCFLLPKLKPQQTGQGSKYARPCRPCCPYAFAQGAWNQLPTGPYPPPPSTDPRQTNT